MIKAEEKNMLRAKDLRKTEQGLTKIQLNPQKAPGYYKWWASKKEFSFLLSELGGNFAKVVDSVEQKDGMYCIYVGIAVKESVQSRINWHINDKHTEKRVQNGILSTLRKSISSIVAKNQYAKQETNDFIDKLKVEVFYSNNKIKSPEAKMELESIEKRLMKNQLFILNIRDNVHPLCVDIKKKLSALRKSSK